MQPDAERDIVLIVDDVPENLAVLSDALDGAGYIVLVAEDGQLALDRLQLITPGIILLDAVMPGIDGFETCRRIKAMPAGRKIPVVFMTGLTETEHIVRGFMAGGIDYVTKPIKPEEVLARIAAHLRNARLVIQTQEAIDAAGLAVAVVNRGGNFLWQTPKARSTLEIFAPTPDDQLYPMPAGLREWVRANIALAPVSVKDEKPFTVEGRDGNMLVVHFLGGMSGNRFLLLVENQRAPRTVATPMTEYRLTSRETEVLSWVAKGKTNRDIGDILKLSPRTVNKHLEHIYVKLGVETRTAAAALAMNMAAVRE